MEERERYSNGLEVRRAVLGDAHVDRAMTRGSAFNQEFQELITRYAWGEIWTRPGLPRHTRSLITLAMMVVGLFVVVWLQQHAGVLARKSGALPPGAVRAVPLR